METENTKKEQIEDIKENSTETKEQPEVKYFQCEICGLRERYEYYGNDPPFAKQYQLLEDAYVIEDPFLPQKQGEFIILGTHCIQCKKSVCKDTNCSLYYDGSYCIHCAKKCSKSFPKSVQEKLNKIIVT